MAHLGHRHNRCASDSKHFGASDQHLTTQWHVRYGGRGILIGMTVLELVLIGWHVTAPPG
jgi:TnpA family transposase